MRGTGQRPVAGVEIETPVALDQGEWSLEEEKRRVVTRREVGDIVAVENCNGVVVYCDGEGWSRTCPSKVVEAVMSWLLLSLVMVREKKLNDDSWLKSLAAKREREW